MAIRGVLRPAVTAAVLLGVAACGEHSAATPPTVTPLTTTVPVPVTTAGLVLRVEHTGGFVTPSTTAGRLPLLSVYADGRVITQGPVPAISPGPALPNLQEQRFAPTEVQDLVDRALAAGVADTSDLGSPPLADATSIRFTVVTGSHTYVREVYALTETPEATAGLTEEQRAARTKLNDLVDTLTGLTDAGRDSVSYAPSAVAALATPWSDPQDGLTQPDIAWPGPPLPGEPLGGLPEVTCATATGEQIQALLTAAGRANLNTPWVTPDGSRWTVTFRPLMPDESSCADLAD
jgi:hypothetical protein